MSNKMYDIYIITDIPFPTGLAPTNRVIAYAKGFIYNFYKVKVICFRKTESNNSINYYTEGVFQGIEYKYLSNSTSRSRFFFKRRFDDFSMILKLFIFSMFNINKNSTVIFYSVSTFAAITLKISALVNKFILLKEETEHPSVRLRRKSNLFAYFFLNFHYPLFHGFLLITQNLVDYFRINYPQKSALHVPMMVEFNRFDLEVKKEKKITYCGLLNDQKDGIDILLKAFSLLTIKFPDYKLILIGDSYSTKDDRKYEKMVKNLNLDDKVDFKGRISNDRIPFELSRSSILVLPRPENVQTKAGFPTKLGEYLASGNPVVATSVGEIPLYLKDGINSFLAIPGNVISFASKLEEVLTSSDSGKKIGMKGRETAIKYFGNEKLAISVIEYVRELKAKKT